MRAEAERAGALFVTERWLGGLLTNFQTVKKQIRRMKELEAGSEAGGEFENYTKKEQLMLAREREKLVKYLNGHQEHDASAGPAVRRRFQEGAHRASSEANKLGIPIVAIVDTNADPDLITVPIAGNDDAIRSVELITKAIADAIVEARREAPVREEDGRGRELHVQLRPWRRAGGRRRGSPSQAPSAPPSREARSHRGAPQGAGRRGRAVKPPPRASEVAEAE